MVKTVAETQIVSKLPFSRRAVLLRVIEMFSNFRKNEAVDNSEPVKKGHCKINANIEK